MAWGDMMGGAMGGMMGGGGGNGGSFAQKRNPAVPFMKPRPQMGGGFGRPMGNQYETRGGMGKPPVGIKYDPGYKDRLNQWMQQPVDNPQMGRTPPFMPGGNTGIAGGIFGRNRGGFGGFGGTPPYFPPNQGGGQQQGPVGVNDAPPQQGGGGFQDMMRKIMEQFGQQRQGGGAMTQGGPASDPRWTNGTWGRGPGIGPRVAPQMNMMPQMMQQPQQPQMQEEEAYY